MKKLLLLTSLIGLNITHISPMHALTHDQKVGLGIVGGVIGAIGAICGAQWVSENYLTSDEEVYKRELTCCRSLHATYRREMEIVERCGFIPVDFVPAGAEQKMERLIGSNSSEYLRNLTYALKEAHASQACLQKRIRRLDMYSPVRYDFENLINQYNPLIKKLKVVEWIVVRLQEAQKDQQVYTDSAHTFVKKQEFYLQELELYAYYAPYAYGVQDALETQLVKIAESKGWKDNYRYPVMGYVKQLSWDISGASDLINKLDSRLLAMYKRYEQWSSHYTLAAQYQTFIAQLKNYHYNLQKIYEIVSNSSAYRHEKSRFEFEEACRRREEEARRREAEARWREEQVREHEREARRRQQEAEEALRTLRRECALRNHSNCICNQPSSVKITVTI
jgi:hypothetical protein